MNDPSIRDQHLDLVALLQKKEQAATIDEVYSIQDEIKNCAKYLHNSSLNNDSHRLDAAFAYYVAGYYVRAIRLISVADSSEDVHPAQRWLALILSKEFKAIEDRAKLVVGDAKYSDSELAREIKDCGLEDDKALDRILCRKLAEAMLAFVEFAHFGHESRLNECYGLLGVSGRLCCAARESVWWWWIECIRLVVREYSENCLWTQLKSMKEDDNSLVSAYIKSNYELSSPVVELWRTQVESIPWINKPERPSFCLAIPTSGGKTRVAELAILRFLIDYQNDSAAKCVYIAPFRKLANEVEQALNPALSAATSSPRVVSSFYGGQEIDPLDEIEIASAKVLIVTPEKLDGMLRSDQNLRSQLKLVIADEGHIVGDNNDRGYKYRMLLERLICALKIGGASTDCQTARLLLVSGVLPKIDEFANLITGDRANKVQIEWRPLDEPRIGNWEWDGRALNTSNDLLAPPIMKPACDCKSSKELEEVLVRTVLTKAENERTIVFSASKKALESESLLNLLNCFLDKYPLGNDPLPTELKSREQYKDYYSILVRGAAIHHGSLPSDLKRETEKRIENGKVRLLFTSPTLAQGANLKFSTVILYRLHHYGNMPISDSTFWNVVGRVGRPVDANKHSLYKLEPPRVVFLINGSASASKEDRRDSRISKTLLANKGKYEITSPFLNFLNEIRKSWRQESGKEMAELVSTLAETSDLAWMSESEAKSKFSALLQSLDRHLIDLMEEANLGEEVDEWPQESLAKVINLLTGATSITPEDLDYIREAVRARAIFVARKVSPKQRKQDYLLGLPFKDCEVIRANQELLLDWYQGCKDTFAGQVESGLDSLILLVNFISKLSICDNARYAKLAIDLKPANKKKKSGKPSGTGPLFQSQSQEEDSVLRSSFFKKWFLGEDVLDVAGVFQRLNNKADFDNYRETMLERELPWGLTAISRYLNLLAQERGITLTKDFAFLPSLVKYGVSSKVACFLARWGIPRENAARITDLFKRKISSDDDSDYDWSVEGTLQEAELAERSVQLLTEDDIMSLGLNDAVIKRINKIKLRSVKGTVQPESQEVVAEWNGGVR